MSMATLEKAILAELKTVAKNPKLTKNSIMEWSTTEVVAQEGEELFFLSEMKIYCVIKTKGSKRALDAKAEKERKKSNP